MSLTKLRNLCVDGFPESTVRADIMAGFESIFERAINLNLTGHVWLDGSFVTQKVDPGDVDFIFLLPSHFMDQGTPEQGEFIEWLIANEDDPRKSFLCHTDVLLVYPENSPERFLTEQDKKHWENQVYGFSVETHEPKGIVVIEVGPPEQPRAMGSK